MKIGIYPAAIQQSYGCHTGRRVVTAWRNVQPYTDTILLNVNNNIFHTYSKTPQAYADKVVKIYNTLKPEIVVVENEEFLKQPNSVLRSLDEMNLYWDELAGACNSLPGKVTNGGLTLPELSYLYYNENSNDQSFFTNNIFKKDELLAGNFQGVIANMQYELNLLKTLPVHSINVHYYIGRVGQTEGLIRMFNWVKTYTGKNIISNEAGILAAGLLPEVVRVARETEMEWLILYSGSGSNALRISKIDFENAII